MTVTPIRKSLLCIGALGLGLLTMPSASSAELACFGEDPTIVGTDGPDTIYLTPNHRDVVVSLGGDDTIRIIDGSTGVDDPGLDLICAGDGNDTVIGHGTRKIHGGAGDDQLSDATGKIFGSSGDDDIFDAPYIDGGAGNDNLSDDSECRASVIYGRAGNDIIHAGYREEQSASDPYELDEVCGTREDSRRDDDIAYGGPGNDLIDGGDNNDRLYGDDGRDRLIGWFGIDKCVGGPGSDTRQTCEKRSCLTLGGRSKRPKPISDARTRTSPQSAVVGRSIVLDSLSRWSRSSLP